MNSNDKWRLISPSELADDVVDLFEEERQQKENWIPLQQILGEVVKQIEERSGK